MVMLTLVSKLYTLSKCLTILLDVLILLPFMMLFKQYGCFNVFHLLKCPFVGILIYLDTCMCLSRTQSIILVDIMNKVQVNIVAILLFSSEYALLFLSNYNCSDLKCTGDWNLDIKTCCAGEYLEFLEGR